MELKLRNVGIQSKEQEEFMWILSSRFSDLIDLFFSSFLKTSGILSFQEKNYRKSMRADTEMKQILKSKLGIV